MLPDGIRTVTLQVGPFLDDAGGPCRGRVVVVSPTPRVWQADGTVFAPRPVEQELDATGTARLTLAATDQPGFADADGTPLTGWTYRVVVALDGHVPVTRDVELPAGTCDGRVVRLVVVPEPLPDAPVPGGPTRPGPDGPEGVPHDRAPGAHRPDGEPAARRGVGRRQLLGALALALPAAAAGTALAGPAAAQGPTPASRAGGRGALLPGLLPAATVLADDVVVGSEARPRSLTIKSSGRAARSAARATATRPGASCSRPTSRTSTATARRSGSTSRTRAPRA